MSMKIISKDSQEAQTVIERWPIKPPEICCMTCPDKVSFSVSPEIFPRQGTVGLRMSQHFYYTSSDGIPAHNHILVLNMPFTTTFCHNIIDLLPELLWLDQQQEYDLILVPLTEMTKDFIDQFKFEFARVKFVEKTFHLRAGKISWYRYIIHQRRYEKISVLREYLMRGLSDNSCCNKMIYCTRNSGGGATHRRTMIHTNHREIIDISRQFDNDNNLNFVIFDGRNRDGSRMSLTDQAQLFSQAKIVFGPHGGAFANIIYIPEKNQCKVCEFTSGLHSAVQRVSRFGKNYNKLLAYAPETYLDYFLIPFTVDSTAISGTAIDIENYQEFLDTCLK